MCLVTRVEWGKGQVWKELGVQAQGRAELQPRPENPALVGVFGIWLEGKGAAGEERRERAGQGGRKGTEKEPHADGAWPFPPGKGPAASAVPQPPNPAWPPFAGAEQLAVPFLIASHRTQTKALFQKERALDPQPGLGEMPREGGREGCPLPPQPWLTARGSWPGWPPRTGCRHPSAGGCSPARPTPPTSCRKRWRMSTSAFPRTRRPGPARGGQASGGWDAPATQLQPRQDKPHVGVAGLGGHPQPLPVL